MLKSTIRGFHRDLWTDVQTLLIEKGHFLKCKVDFLSTAQAVAKLANVKAKKI